MEREWYSACCSAPPLFEVIEVKEINISTKQGRLDWLEYKAKDDWTYLEE